jgi:hypothetical protein
MGYPRPVARVDPDDDDVRRFVVRHYRYDPERRERRHVVVAAFDNEREFRACMENARAEIGRRRDRGEAVDPREHVSGTVQEPGHSRRAANGRLVMRAIRHGVGVAWIDDLEMPSSMAVVRATRLRTDDPAGAQAEPAQRIDHAIE